MQVQQLAVQFLANWADSSLINCGKIAVLGGGGALSAALQDADLCSEAYKSELLNAMAILARDCPMRYASLTATICCAQQLVMQAMVLLHAPAWKAACP